MICPSCKRKLAIKPEHIGKTVACRCGKRLRIEPRQTKTTSPDGANSISDAQKARNTKALKIASDDDDIPSEENTQRDKVTGNFTPAGVILVIAALAAISVLGWQILATLAYVMGLSFTTVSVSLLIGVGILVAIYKLPLSGKKPNEANEDNSEGLEEIRNKTRAIKKTQDLEQDKRSRSLRKRVTKNRIRSDNGDWDLREVTTNQGWEDGRDRSYLLVPLDEFVDQAGFSSSDLSTIDASRDKTWWDEGWDTGFKATIGKKLDELGFCNDAGALGLMVMDMGNGPSFNYRLFRVHESFISLDRKIGDLPRYEGDWFIKIYDKEEGTAPYKKLCSMMGMDELQRYNWSVFE